MSRPPEAAPSEARERPAGGSAGARTLPPPEWATHGPRRESRPAVVAPPLPRPFEGEAKEAMLRAELAAARIRGDASAERASALSLSALLAREDWALDEAVRLGLTALALGEDAPLRRRVATWLERLGAPMGAAELLRPLCTEPTGEPDDRLRLAELSARAGDASGARAALMELEAHLPHDPEPSELRGAVCAWAEQGGAEAAAEAYAEASARRLRRGDEGALVDALRAFDADPSARVASDALAAALVAVGRPGVATEVRRVHVGVLAADGRPFVRGAYAMLGQEALARGDVAAALALALDARIDARLEPSAEADARELDDLLARLGLSEVVVARLELRACVAAGEARSRLLLECARALADVRGRAEESHWAYARALAEDPSADAGRIALEAYAAETGSLSPLAWSLAAALGRSAEVAEAARALAEDVLARTEDDARAPHRLALAAALRGDHEATRGFARELLERGAQEGAVGVLRALRVARLFPDDRIAHAMEASARALATQPLDDAVRAEVMVALVAATVATSGGAGASADADEDGGPARGERSDEPCFLVPPATREAIASWLDGSDAPRAAALAWAVGAASGDDALVARALAALASSQTGELAATLLAAGSLRAVANDVPLARALAYRATEAAPASVGARRVLADVLVTLGDTADAWAVAQAVDATYVTSAWADALAEWYAEADDLAEALSWVKRMHALRPTDVDVLARWVALGVEARDAGALSEAADALLEVPLPRVRVTGPLARALEVLNELLPTRAAEIAARTIDRMGPDDSRLRDAVLHAARSADDRALERATLLRAVAADLPTFDAAGAYLTVARLARVSGDRDEEARALARALRAGASPTACGDAVLALDGACATPDGKLAWLEARAVLSSSTEDASTAFAAYRELGAARWHAARDRALAIEAWLEGARLGAFGAFSVVGQDLTDTFGAAFAAARLEQLAEVEEDDVVRSALRTEAARASLEAGEPARALELAARAIDDSAAHADAVALAERAASEAGREAELSALYDALGAKALGRFGLRAAHYRAARFFEKCGMPSFAVRHAAQAFSAVPSEGATFVLLARTAAAAGDRALAVRAIERVAEDAPRSERRAEWLLRAADVAGPGEEGARQKLEVLLRAVVLRPDARSIKRLSDCAREVLRAVPEERAALEVRLARASSAIADKLDGPDGARVGVALAELALDLFDDASSALSLLERALACDADLDEFASLAPYASRLAGSSAAWDTLARVLRAAEKPYASVGVPAMRLVAAIAHALGDADAHARALVLAVERDAENDALVREADQAVCALGDDALAARLERALPPAARVAVLVEFAEARRAEGAHREAIEALERASDLAPPSHRESIERALREALEAAGLREELEARTLRDAMRSDLPPAERARRWAEIAERRETNRDVRGALSALLEAARAEPESVERWSALERVAELAGDDDIRIEALHALVKRVTPSGRVAVCKRLARAYESRGDAEAAEQTWRTVHEANPDDEDADLAIEQLIVGRGRFSELASHLSQRAERMAGRSGQREQLRAVRLRRAAILEQRLGRVEDACAELETLLLEWPDNASALRYLADLCERMGEFGRAAPLWRRVMTLEREPSVQRELELRAARASWAGGDGASALRHVHAVLTRTPGEVEAIELLVSIARALGDARELGDALERRALLPIGDAVSRSGFLVEAAQAAARMGDTHAALTRAQKAAELAPEHAATQLLARGLEYRLRGAGAPDDARRTLDELGRVRSALTRDDAALRSFLLAEALDVLMGGGAGMRELVARREELGPQPLVSLGIAERLVSQGAFEESLPLFREALEGSLLGLRRRGSVALAAADAAQRAGDLDGAASFLEEASKDPDARAVALRRLGSGTRRTAPSSVPPPSLDLARPVSSHPASSASAPREGGPRERRAAVSTAAPSSITLTQTHEVDELEAAVRSAGTAVERAQARLALAHVKMAHGAAGGAETLLWDALYDGSVEAGNELAAMLSAEADRRDELVRVRRRQVEIAPGDRGLLEALRDAAVVDGNAAYARAVEHVLTAFEPEARRVLPPPLEAQASQPGVLALLARPSFEVGGTALGIVWEGAQPLFARDAALYGLDRLEPLAVGDAAPLGRCYDELVRLLDVPRLPVFLQRGTGPVAPSVAVMSPPTIIVSGNVRSDEGDARLALGAGLAAALPQNILVQALSDREARSVWAAVLGAFGPTELGRGLDVAASRFAEAFWSVIPPRGQRQLQELLGAGRVPPFELVRARARQSGRRVALFATGDFAASSLALLAEEGGRLDARRLGQEGGLKQLCAELPDLADLVRLATSVEYADARWQPPSAATSARVRSTTISSRG